jgi:hypothetical protein
MRIADIVIWESTDILLLVPVVVGLVMLIRRLQGRPSSPTLIGGFCLGIRARKLQHSFDNRVCDAMLGGSAGGLGIAFYVLLFSLWWFAGATILAVAGILFLAPKWLV